jgi:6-phosphogluconate dehydrogenase
MKKQKYDYGMIGLGTMGRNLVYNMCDNGYSVAGFDKNKEQVKAFMDEGTGKKITGTTSLKKFVASLKAPRAVMLLVPAGPVVDSVITELRPYLSKRDLIMDCGNSHYTDTNLRTEKLAKKNIHFMGIGISGGEQGARYGPSIMPGGDPAAYKRVAPMLKAVAAKIRKEPCVAWMGNGSAGHYVKMVHNGIEYGIMQLVSETYQLLKQAGLMSNDEIQVVFSHWNKGKLQSFLVEITAAIFAQPDDLSSNRLIDMILDTAHQKGTGAWTSEDAMAIGVPLPLIDAAVEARNISAYKKERVEASKILKGPGVKFTGNKKELVSHLEDALYFSMIAAYAQGMALLQQASREYKYELQLSEIARIWRGGCIIRASLLEEIRSAYLHQPDLPNLLVDKVIGREMNQSQAGLRKIIQIAVETGIPAPGMMAALAYYDGYRSAWLPANLIQAQRDYFGAHTYERTDRKGVFHTKWNEEKS